MGGEEIWSPITTHYPTQRGVARGLTKVYRGRGLSEPMSLAVSNMHMKFGCSHTSHSFLREEAGQAGHVS